MDSHKAAPCVEGEQLILRSKQKRNPSILSLSLNNTLEEGSVGIRLIWCSEYYLITINIIIINGNIVNIVII